MVTIMAASGDNVGNVGNVVYMANNDYVNSGVYTVGERARESAP